MTVPPLVYEQELPPAQRVERMSDANPACRIIGAGCIRR
jgi:hypothetical protein